MPRTKVNQLGMIGDPERKLKYADIMQTLVSRLISTTEPNTMVDVAIVALRKLLLHHTVSYLIPLQPRGQSAMDRTIQIFANGSIGKSYFKHIQKDMLGFVEGLPSYIANREDLKSHLQTKVSYIMLAGDVDEEKTAVLHSAFCVPFRIAGRNIGIIHIASAASEPYTTQDIDEATNLVNTAATIFHSIGELIYISKLKEEAMLESIGEGLVVTNIDRKVSIFNHAAERMTGWQASEVIGKRWPYVIGFCDQNSNLLPHSEQPIHQAFSTRTIVSNTISKPLYLAKKTRELFPVVVTAAPVTIENIVMLTIVVFRDVTIEIEVDKRKTEFVSVASHQLRTPLSAIKLFTEMLVTEEVGSLNLTQRQYMENIQHSTERMIKLVNSLLNVARLESGRMRIEPRLLRLEELIPPIIAEIEVITEVWEKKKCKIVFEKPTSAIPETLIDEGMMTEVIRNLVANAARYSPRDSCAVKVSITVANSDIIIKVADKGIGIPHELQYKVFEKFFRAPNAVKLQTEGNGLGLYIVKLVVEASGGKLWFESEGQGKGATFFVSIPKKGMIAKVGEKELAETSIIA